MLWIQINFNMLRDMSFWYEPRETTVQQSHSNLHEEVKIARLAFYFKCWVGLGLGLV